MTRAAIDKAVALLETLRCDAMIACVLNACEVLP
jgi:hypothetical protein